MNTKKNITLNELEVGELYRIVHVEQSRSVFGKYFKDVDFKSISLKKLKKENICIYLGTKNNMFLREEKTYYFLCDNIKVFFFANDFPEESTFCSGYTIEPL